MSKFMRLPKTGAVLAATIVLGLAAGDSVAAPYNAWLQPYTGASDIASSKVLMHFDETSGTVATNSGNTVGWGTADGAYSPDASGNTASGAGIPATGFGTAFNSSSSTTLSIPSAPSLVGPFTGSLAIEAWIKPDATVGGGEQVIASKYDTTLGSPGGRQWYLSVNNAGNVYFGTFRSDGVLAELFSTSVLTAGTWYHVAAQYDTSDARWELWINDSQEATSSAGAWGFTSTTNPISVGSFNGTGSYFTGQIDEFRISEGAYDFSLVPEPGALALSLFGLSLAVMRRSHHRS